MRQYIVEHIYTVAEVQCIYRTGTSTEPSPDTRYLYGNGRNRCLIMTHYYIIVFWAGTSSESSPHFSWWGVQSVPVDALSAPTRTSGAARGVHARASLLARLVRCRVRRHAATTPVAAERRGHRADALDAAAALGAHCRYSGEVSSAASHGSLRALVNLSHADCRCLRRAHLRDMRSYAGSVR